MEASAGRERLAGTGIETRDETMSAAMSTSKVLPTAQRAAVLRARLSGDLALLLINP